MIRCVPRCCRNPCAATRFENRRHIKAMQRRGGISWILSARRTKRPSSRLSKGRSSRGHSLGRGERGACGRICNPLPGGIGHHPAGTTTGMRGARYTGTVVRFSGVGNTCEWCMILPENRHPLFRIMHGEAQGLRLPVEAAVQDRTLRTAPRKHGLVPGLGDQLSPWPEPQWDAERRARSARARPVPARRGSTYASLGVPLPLLFAAWVGTGKNPGIAQGEAVRKNGGMKNSRANKNRAVRPGALCLSAPAIAGEGDHAKRGGGGF